MIVDGANRTGASSAAGTSRPSSTPVISGTSPATGLDVGRSPLAGAPAAGPDASPALGIPSSADGASLGRRVYVPVPQPYRAAGSSSSVDSRQVRFQPESVRLRGYLSVEDPRRVRTEGVLEPSTRRSLESLVERYGGGARIEPTPDVVERQQSLERIATRRENTAALEGYRQRYERGPLDRLSRPYAATTGTSGAAQAPASRLRPVTTERPLAEGAATAAPSGLDVESRRSALARLEQLAETDPQQARRIASLGAGAAALQGITTELAARPLVGSALSKRLGTVSGGALADYAGNPNPYWTGYGSTKSLSVGLHFGWSGYGYGPYGCWSWPWSWGLSCWWWGWHSYPTWCNNWYGWYSPYWHHPYGWYGYGWTYCPPLYYSNVIYTQAYAQPDPQVIVVETQPTTTYVVEQPAAPIEEPAVFAPAATSGITPEPAGPDGSSGIGLAAERYLTLGDRAFRDERWADAVHYYSKATELEPEVGVLYLVLADALFATGDYGYAAFAVRKAFELEPALVYSTTDKRDFYVDPSSFDAQLGVLSEYLADHPSNDDARLVLALNQLFSAAPSAALATLDAELGVGLVTDQAAVLVREAAGERMAQGG